MKRLIYFFVAGVFLLVTACSEDPFDLSPELPQVESVAPGEYPPEISEAIETGIEWLLDQQHTPGYFGSTFEGVARTALAVTKLCDRSVEMGYPSPTADDAPYSTQIMNGLNYIFSNAEENPDGGIYLSTNFNHSVYNTGIAMMALAAARCPDCVITSTNTLVDGITFFELLQANVQFFIAAQNPDGGWRYYDHSQPSDNSNTGFAVLGLMAAEGAGVPIPASLKSNLSDYIDYIQNDISGGSGYTIPTSWVNIMKTGNLLFEMAFVGDNMETPRVQAALGYIENNWNATGDVGWQPNNFLSMYCLMKGFVSMGIETITVGTEEVNWYDEIALEILNDLPWPLPSSLWVDSYLSSVFSLLTLEKITPVPYIMVNVDVKPTSCPNPLNRKSKGVVPIAILGTEAFDVTNIDPATINIEGIAPLRWSYEDVAAPYEEGFSDPLSKMDCTNEGPDGLTDLLFHFKTEEIATLFPDEERGDLVIINIDGQLIDDGAMIIGEDVMIIVK